MQHPLSLISIPGLLLAIAFHGGRASDMSQAADALPESTPLIKTFVSELVHIMPGMKDFPESFVMGAETGSASEKPAHQVKIVYDFWIAKYEVPQNLYEAVMGNNPSRWKGPRNSVEMFSFDDAQEFCKKMSRLLHEAKLIATDEEIRLPTEAEWEYSCRAGTTTAYSFGDSAVKPNDKGNQASLLDEFGWHTGNAAGNDPPVGARKPNAWGLYDMHGYLWEFVSDAWHETYAGAPADGSRWDSTDEHPRHVIRGGSWKDRHEALRSFHRRSIAFDAKDDAVGLRCVRAKIRQP